MIAVVDIDAQRDDSASGNAVRHIANLAERSGWRSYAVPRDFDAVGGADNALWHVPTFESPQRAVWVGYMAPPDVYEKAYEGLASRNVFLINNPDQHLRSEEFDAWYPQLEDLTCLSAVVETPEEAVYAAQRIGYPVFLKGTVQSLKAEGLSSCRADNDGEVIAVATRLLQHASRTRGRVVVREMMQLRSSGVGPTGMPATREFRVFVLDGTVADTGYYWPIEDSLAKLQETECRTIERLAVKVQETIDVPWLAVDIGQLDNGDWQMIEIGDAQFAGTCHASPFRLLEALRTRD
ncbi:MAG: ATP-grasp domain-containing protein, partial [Acidobacteriota bacterium]